MNKIFFFLLIFLFISCYYNDNEFKEFNSIYNDAYLENLLISAKISILNEFDQKNYDKFQNIPFSNDNIGVFIRLINNEKERGCIGFYKGVKNLRNAVRIASINAAFHDPRFPPLKIEELKTLYIEITVVGKFKKINNSHNFKPGKDSILIDDYSHRAFL